MNYEKDCIRDVLICLSHAFSSLLSRAFKEGGKAWYIKVVERYLNKLCI